MNLLRYSEPDFPDYLNGLIESGRIEDKEIGIIKYFLDHGYETLSEKQRYVFNRAIEDNSVNVCTRCAIDIPWCEMLEALDNGGYCNYCQHMMEKEEEEDEKFDLHSISGSTIEHVNSVCVRSSQIVTDTKQTVDSSINLSYTLCGGGHEHKITDEEIQQAFQKSLENK